MTDIVKLFTGGFWRYVVAWLLPCVVFLSALLLTAYPSVKSLPALRHIDALASSNSTLGAVIFGAAALGISVVLALCYEPVYRLWEGYPWPRPLFIAGRSREIKRYKSLAKRINTHVARAQEAKDAKDNSLAAY